MAEVDQILALMAEEGGVGIAIEDKMLMDVATREVTQGKALVMSLLLHDVWHEIAIPLDAENQARSLAAILELGLELSRRHKLPDLGGCDCQTSAEPSKRVDLPS